MKIYAIICTRTKELKPVTSGLLHTLSSFGVDVKVLANQDSIFSAYKKGLEMCHASAKDIVIFCHDDIQLLNGNTDFHAALGKCLEEETGIVGPAGTACLGSTAVWWDKELWRKGYHRGGVDHVSDIHNNERLIQNTHYGPYGQVVALDGLFLAARKEVWDTIGLQKPPYFEGLWDFYDIHYTTTAHKLNYKNYAVPIRLIHLSTGQLVGRDSWHKNREAFIKQTELPLTLKNE